ncbi:MAG: hypothetical protein IKL82_04545 [Clostridia bacterium]|nr:hypothetical protein [Clostridia bacterium]
MNKYYRVLGASPLDTDEVIKEKYYSLRSKYQEERFEEGEKGNRAAQMLTELDVAYQEIMASRNEKINESGTSSAFESVESAIKAGNLQAAQQLLDDFNERNAEWHYFQSVVFYKKNWINESKKQLEIAVSMCPNEQKYKDALSKLEDKVKQGERVNPDWNKSSSGSQEVNVNQQLGGDGCAQWCCDMIICNTILNCCCNCR